MSTHNPHQAAGHSDSNGIANGIVHQAATSKASLDLATMYGGARIMILGGTGFLGKILWGMLLDKFPMTGKIFLLVRASKGKTSEQRFWESVATSESLTPLREKHGAGYEAFLREKIVPIDGDMGRAKCGIDEGIIRELRGTIDVVLNIAGVVDFNPPLDEALEANAFGAQNLVALARALGDVPVMHTSTCYTCGNRAGLVHEEDPRDYPFPRCKELGAELWDPDREIAECLDLVAQARHRCEDAFRQSEFLEKAKDNLKKRGEPAYGTALDDEFAKVKRKFTEQRLTEVGLDRAEHWGWPNIYTYTKSIGEQVIARSGLAFTIARPAICESTLEYPFPGWNEGINTSAPFIYLCMKGQQQFPATGDPIDFIPSDVVVSGMLLTLAELLEGTHKPMYQYGASDINPCAVSRFAELMGLYKRKHYQRKGTGNPIVNFLQAHLEPIAVSPERLETFGPRGIARVSKQLASVLRQVEPLKPVAKSLQNMAAREDKIADILDLFTPFTAVLRGPFSCANTRAAHARLSPEDQGKLVWRPETIDWAHYWMGVHMPAIEKRIIPEMDKKYGPKAKSLRAHPTLVTMLTEMGQRYEHALALQLVQDDGLSRVTYADMLSRVRAVAARLAAIGVKPKERVVLAGQNDPAWAIAYFGILFAGATAVPIDPALDGDAFSNVVRESGAAVALWDSVVENEKSGKRVRELHPELRVVDLWEIAAEDASLVAPEVTVDSSDVASLIYTSGTTGHPKGVMLTHGNFTSLIAALAPVFPLGSGDRVMSVLPLHHTFEFTCGLLLPLSRGSRVVYIGELTSEALSAGLKEARATAMVGVPALWQVLERRILSEVEAKGPVAEALFEWGGQLNRMLGKTLGVDIGKVLFGSVHDAMGGNFKYLISGGAALPKGTHKLFGSLGLHLTEGYGLTEAAPVLTVAKPSPKSRAGHVGKPIPGVEIKIANADSGGVGEVLARGANVMAGYTDEDATRAVIDEEGWLRTGDLGRFDRKGQLELVGRSKDVIVAATGENIYPDDLENRLGKIAHVEELAIVGITGREGGERIACLAVPEADNEVPRAERMDRAMRSLRAAINELPFGMRPQVIQLYEAALPKTGTRKVKRNEVRQILNRLVAASQRPEAMTEGSTPVRVAIAAVRGKAIEEIRSESTLVGDLGFDSLSLSELVVALESKYGFLEPDAVLKCQSVGDLEALVGAPKPESRTRTIQKSEDPIVLPKDVQEYGKRAISVVQDVFYGQAMKPVVTGRSFIPHNRNTLVVANHASHLDMGFVRHALGPYGEDIVSLAAQDYFFDKDRIRRAFFENFTNLKAVDRKASLRQAERQAAQVIEEGNTMLVFPEGTRSEDGQIHEFKALIGHLALTYGVDILPIWLGGTSAALPKGSVLIPRKRNITARIGPPLCVADLRRLTEGMNRADASREAARLAREAVLALRDGVILDLAKMKKDAPVEERVHPLVSLFGELEAKFRPRAVDKPLSFYFTLGGDDMAKWTVIVEPERVDIKPGKPASGTADCVLKTSPEIFTKIVREAYTPTPAEFISGAIKSNDIELLQRFQKIFQLA